MADGQFDIVKIGLSEAEAPGADHWALIMDTENSDALTVIYGDPIQSYVLGAVGAALTELTPAQLSADTDDWNPTGMGTANMVLMSSDAARNLTGIVWAGTAPGAKRKTLINVGAFPITLKDQFGSAGANQFLLNGGTGDIVLQPGDAQDIYYDETDGKWRSV
jgi:hypothetical protein